MKSLFWSCLAFALAAGVSVAAVDKRVDINNFESDSDFDITVTGATILYSLVDDPQIDDVPRHEGEYALYGEYDVSSGAYTQTSITFPAAVDLRGMRELHFWIYFLKGSVMHQSGDYRMRVLTQNGNELGEPHLTTAGEWHHVVLPIDRVNSEELSAFNRLNIIWMVGANNAATGKFYIDEIYGLRPGNTPGVKETLIYGFNKPDSQTGYPQGWTIRAADAVDLMMGDAIVAPSEGADYLESVMPGGWKRPIETIAAKNDFDQWDKVIDIAVDLRMSADFSGTWHNFQLVLESSSGGYRQYSIRNGNIKDSWRTVAWDVDMAPHLGSFSDPAGWFKLSFITQAADGVTGSVYIDNLRVGIATTYVLGERRISGTAYQGGETFDVQLDVSAEGDAQNYQIIENTPAGWTVSQISDGGVFSNGAIEWNINLGSGTKTVSYKITAPQNANSTVDFSGTVGGIATRGMDSIFYVYPKLWELRVECPFARNTVKLDGLIDQAEYANAKTYSFNHDTTDGNQAPGVHIFGNEYPASQQSVTFHVFHDEEAIYVACDITDSNLAFNENATQAWNDDSVEVFLDGNLSRTTDREDGPLGIQCTVVGDGHLIGGNNVPAIKTGTGYMYSDNGSVWNFGARVKADGSGYVVEYQLIKALMLSPVDRDIAGFEILMNDAELGAGQRTGKWGFYSTKDDGTIIEAHQDESAWALIQLLPNDSPVGGWAIY
ncbi:MAG: hypothetical protein GC154_18905 [bacterium]|nr:hypothetical protein [bacterium]